MAFGVVNHSQDHQCNFFLPSSIPHQWFDIVVLILSQIATGKRKQLITYNGIAWMTDFNIISLPALERGRSLHPLSFFHIRSGRKLKVFVGDPPTEDGMPK